MADKIVMRSVEELIPYARNARTHSDEQVAQIAGSIREFGFTNPLLLDVLAQPPKRPGTADDAPVLRSETLISSKPIGTHAQVDRLSIALMVDAPAPPAGA
jgi:hypothetical protein